MEAALTCPNCGAQDSGAYCSACGAALQGKPRHAYHEFLDAFLKLGDLKQYLTQYGTILRSPIRNTVESFEQGHLQGALRFAEWSLAIYALLILSDVVVLRTQEWLAALLLTLMTVVSWSVGLWTHYLLVRKKARIERSFRSYLTMSCLYIGFVIPPLSLATWVQSFWPLAGIVLVLVTLVPVFIYAVQVWMRFWALPGKTVLFYFVLSGLAGTAASYTFIFIVFSLFPGSRLGLFEFDEFLSVDMSQLFDGYVHAQIDDVVPYTHPAGFFKMDAPSQWNVAEKDSLDEYTVDWVAPHDAGLIRVHLFADETNASDEALIDQVRRRIPAHPFLTMQDAVEEPNGTWRIPFTYLVYAFNWLNKPAHFTTQGYAFGQRHGDAMLVFITLIAKEQEEELAPHLTHIRQSLSIEELPETWVRPQLRSQDHLLQVIIEGFVRHTQPDGLFALDVPDTWTSTTYAGTREVNTQWTDPHENGLIILKIVQPDTSVSDAELETEAEAFVRNSFGMQDSLSMNPVSWETEDHIRIDYTYIAHPWLGLGTVPPVVTMGGELRVERRGTLIVVFCTLAPVDQLTALAPAFTRMRHSLFVNQMLSR